MKTSHLITTSIIVLIIAACSSTRKSSASVAISAPASTTTTSPSVFLAPPDGIYAPGDAELTAIRKQYEHVTLDLLKEGHLIYTQGACINCHGPENIYSRDEAKWKDIIDNMAQKAGISDAQKDAVYKYVLAIKATQVK
ncbi:MAG: c-type cytochrome [Bacteroidia bacterium]